MKKWKGIGDSSMNRRPKSGEIYRHFKNKMYQIVTIARHSETGEELVIYQALYGDYKCCARPLEMFISEVDHEKYPDVQQTYRFERVEFPEQENVYKKDTKKDVKKQKYYFSKEIDEQKSHNLSDSSVQKINETKNSMFVEKNSDVTYFSANSLSVAKNKIKTMTAEEKMMAFFDTEDLEERYQILSSLRDELTDTMIDNMAVVMDVVIEDGNITKRYDDLKYAIQTKQRYEQNTRLR